MTKSPNQVSSGKEVKEGKVVQRLMRVLLLERHLSQFVAQLVPLRSEWLMKKRCIISLMFFQVSLEHLIAYNVQYFEISQSCLMLFIIIILNVLNYRYNISDSKHVCFLLVQMFICPTVPIIWHKHLESPLSCKLFVGCSSLPLPEQLWILILVVEPNYKILPILSLELI